MGVPATAELVAAARGARPSLGDLGEALAEEVDDAARRSGVGSTSTAQPSVILVVGVNGVGKTTTIGKLATRLAERRRTVLARRGDTFRAAAVEQLEIWAKRVGAEVVKAEAAADPASVAFDAIERAQAADADVVIVDTAGRLHTRRT